MQEERRLERERTTLRFALFALLLLSPLPFGSVQPWAVLGLELCAAGLGAWSVWIGYRDPESLLRPARRLLIPVSFLVLIGILQLIPVPGAWVRVLAKPTAEARTAVARAVPVTSSPVMPESLSPPDTVDAGLRLIGCILVGLASAVSIRSPGHLKHAALVITISGVFQAVYGSAEYLSGHQHIFGYEKKYFNDEASGTFINRNHFAGYLAMTLPFALSLALEGGRLSPRARSWRERILHVTEPGRLLRAACGLGAGLIWIGVLLSYSRGGLAAALAATAILVLMASARKRLSYALVAALAVATGSLLVQEVRAPGERFFAEEVTSLGGRIPVWRATVEIVPPYLPLGSGLGTYEAVFASHRPPTVERRWNHAHNDWLESLAEGGAGLTLLLIVLSCLVLRPSILSAGRSTASMACSAAILAIAIHSTVDFSLRIPAIAFFLACTAGMSYTKDPRTISSFTGAAKPA